MVFASARLLYLTYKARKPAAAGTAVNHRTRIEILQSALHGANAAVPQVSCARKKSAFGAAYAETAPGNNKGGTKK